MGGLLHEDFRCFRNEWRTCPQKGIVDGDLIERLVELDPLEIKKVVRQLNDNLAKTKEISELSSQQTSQNAKVHSSYSVEDVIRRVEDIIRKH